MEEERLVGSFQMIRSSAIGTTVANRFIMKWTEHLKICSYASGGGILILALGMGLAYLLFILTGAII